MTAQWKRRRHGKMFGELRGCERLEERSLLAADFAGTEYVPGEILVQFAPNATAAKRASVRSAVGGELAETIWTGPMRASGMGSLERVKIAPGIALEKALAAYERMPLVAYAEPNYIFRPAVISNDTYYTGGSLWGMYGSDTPSAVGPSRTTNSFGIDAERAWNAGITGSSNVVVGIIDEGVQVTHPDLAGNIWVNPYDPIDGFDNDGNGYVDDVHGWDFVYNNNSVYDSGEDAHGTHVAGTIGGVGGNGSGVVGVNWDVAMISTKFLGPTGGSLTNAVKALDYLTDLKVRHGINLVATNNSWGGGSYSQSLHNAILRSAKQDILFVAAAGNSTTNNDTTASYPSNYNTKVGTSTQSAASYDSVIAVASITSSGALSGFSSYGAATVDLGAPGSGIWSSVPANSYASYNGTSMATPHVTGAIALYASTQSQPIDGATLRNAILSTTTPTTSLAGKTVTGGRLNVYNAIQAGKSPGITVSAATPSTVTTEAGGSVSFTLVLNAAPTANVTIPISSDDPTEATVNISSLVFTPANWAIPQTVTVTGVNDFIDDGNVNYSVVLGAALSSDANYNGRDPADVSLSNQDDDTAGVTVSSPTPGNQTTESGGFVSFTINLNSEPLADVTIGISSSDTTEGIVDISSLTFTPANWSVPQSVTVTGVDDSLYEGNVSYTIVTGAASSDDLLYNGRAVADVSLVNVDDELPPPTKFYVVDDATLDQTYEYTADVVMIENYSLAAGNAAPRGVATTSTGDKVWVVDRNRNVYVYDTAGTLLGSWTAGSLSTNAVVEGIATDGAHIWIVDAKADRLFYYANAATRLSGSLAATGSYALGSGNTNPKDLVYGSDGVKRYLWVVNDAATDKVFRYVLNANGSPVTSTTGVDAMISWNLASANKAPTGITLDPAATTGSLWVVDSGTDRIYEYAGARGSTAGSLVTSYQLAAGNLNPQGIADPPPRLEPSHRIGTNRALAVDLLMAAQPLVPPSRQSLPGPPSAARLVSPLQAQPVKLDDLGLRAAAPRESDSTLDLLTRNMLRRRASMKDDTESARAADQVFGEAYSESPVGSPSS